jgi:hypothetical protein
MEGYSDGLFQQGIQKATGLSPYKYKGSVKGDLHHFSFRSRGTIMEKVQKLREISPYISNDKYYYCNWLVEVLNQQKGRDNLRQYNLSYPKRGVLANN